MKTQPRQLFLESKIDTSKIYFHGSSEARVSKLEAPSFEHPFYVTPDLHYAMAFCTKSQSQTGDYDVQKTFTPADSNYVYAVTLSPSCKVFDFRDHASAEFQKLYSFIDEELVEWLKQNNSCNYDLHDIYEFIAALMMYVLQPVDESNANFMAYDKRKDLLSTSHMPPKLFLKACSFSKKNGLHGKMSELDVHDVMAMLLKKLKTLGFQGVLTRERDYNDEVSPSAEVATDYAIGIFDVKGLDVLSLVPMKYKWLKKTNPSYLDGMTGESATAKVKRFIELYKKIAGKSQIDEEESISDNDVYLSNMAKSFKDKAWFLKMMPAGVKTVVDFGGGAGDFIEHIRSQLEDDVKMVVIDNNASFLSQAKKRGIECFTSLQELRAAKGSQLRDALLILSSVIHEVYSYADSFYDDVGTFWSDVKKCGFKCIALRDMSYDEKAMRNAPVDAILWVYENVLKSDEIAFKGIPFKQITDSFEEVWGGICDVQAHKVNVKRLFHFLIKYRYQENWDREVQENYLPVSQEKLAWWLTSFMPYSFKHKESSHLEFYDKCWTKDLKLNRPDTHGYGKKFLEWLKTLSTHIKWFMQSSGDHTALAESKTDYLKKHFNEPDVDSVVDKFWQIRHRLSAPQNDISWWMKKPYSELKRFVLGFDMSNKRQRRDIDYRKQMVDNDARLLGFKDGYEIWYVPTYEAMRTIGRFYKGASTEWCVSSDDPSFWFDIHDMSEFIVLVREHMQHDEFDKIAIEMQNGGRAFDVDEFITWDVENEDDRFCNDSLIHYAWELFIDNGERRRGL